MQIAHLFMRIFAAATRSGNHARSAAGPLTEIGLRLEFSSSQYFATAFKRVTGQTPRAYRAARLRRSS